jgi:hypothetical protein
MLYKIYKIVNNIDNRVYIGSTKQPLYKRWNEHKKRWRREDLTQYASHILFDAYGYEQCLIVLEEEFNADNKEQVNRKEREVIDKYKSVCVNLHLPYKTEQELKEDRKKYAITKYSKPEFRKNELEKKATPYCCIICRAEMRRDNLLRHFRVKH